MGQSEFRKNRVYITGIVFKPRTFRHLYSFDVGHRHDHVGDEVFDLA
jgi:hypothetical protein